MIKSRKHTEKTKQMISESRKKYYIEHPEARKKLSEDRKGKSTWNKGGHLTKEWKRKIGEANKISLKGRKIPLEIRNNMSNAKIGHKVSEETRIKIGNSRRGRKHTDEVKKKISMAQIGKKLSKETKIKIGNAHMGMKRPIGTGEKISKALKGIKRSKEVCEKIRQLQLGRKLSEQWKENISMANKNSKKVHRGSNHPFWKGGVTPENLKIRQSRKYNLWREAVFARDNWTCQKSGQEGGELRSHHIKNFSEYPELKFVINNGITFSEKAHNEFHKIYGYKNNNKKQVKDFIKDK